jgi:hypothetical protein
LLSQALDKTIASDDRCSGRSASLSELSAKPGGRRHQRRAYSASRRHLGVEPTSLGFIGLDPFDELGMGQADQLIEKSSKFLDGRRGFSPAHTTVM